MSDKNFDMFFDFMMFEELMKEEDAVDELTGELITKSEYEDKYSWRDFYDGIDIDSNEYETEEDYLEAVEENW